jgi:hypothetical protein
MTSIASANKLPIHSDLESSLNSYGVQTSLLSVGLRFEI